MSDIDEFQKYASKFTEDEWEDLGLDKIFIAGMKAARAQGGEAVGWIRPSIENGDGWKFTANKELAETWSRQGKQVTPVYAHASASVPEESRPLTANRYGVDRDYFTKKLEILIRDMRDYTPDELARSLGRLAMTADSETMQESEFTTTPTPADKQ